MKALQIIRYGKPDVALQFRDIEAPSRTLKDKEVYVKIKAFTINPLDIKFITGAAKIIYPLSLPTTAGHDVSGTVQAIGPSVTQLKVGDDVFFSTPLCGAWQEYIVISEDLVAVKPYNITFEEAAALPIIAGTALLLIDELEQSVADRNIKKVFVSAGLGGVGYMIVQMLKLKGYDVTTTVSTGKMEKAKELLSGVTILDYKTEDVGSKLEDSFDLVYDTTGDTALAAKIVRRNGVAYSIAAVPSTTSLEKRNISIPVLVYYIIRAIFWVYSRPFNKKNVSYDYFIFESSADLLTRIAELCSRKSINVLIGKVFEWEQAIEAVTLAAESKIIGKIVVRL
ncbi:chaperonin 10-like protein [Dipodascopsis uninucleata]